MCNRQKHTHSQTRQSRLVCHFHRGGCLTHNNTSETATKRELNCSGTLRPVVISTLANTMALTMATRPSNISVDINGESLLFLLLLLLLLLLLCTRLSFWQR
mmetsp:Transcript_23891/g.36784  ORF Transcript_23891/g.36784 Transcript_23891/m.36784 type:complete len:102 (+) Transcript_23891:75-380(+)